METWFRQGQIQPEVFERWTCPYVVRLISPIISVLAELPRGLFIAYDFMNVDENYCPRGGELESFYRMVAWTKTVIPC
jgi:hypothetical protein